jgi:23S rRNA-/tRNA-specific pseudouridylate synthase
MPLFVTQRIDIPVSGLVILAKTPEFQRLFNRFLSERRIEKRYKALVEKPVGEGKYSHFMEQSDRAPKRMSEKNIPNWVSCELTVHSCRAVSDLYECEVELHTGRTHQIRAQLSFLGASIVGDFLYRAKKKAPEILGEGAIGLHSYQVSWSQRRGEKTEYRHDPIW